MTRMVDNTNEVSPVDFFINQQPVSISFICPYCDLGARINWNELAVPEYWGDDWGTVLCPYCEKEVELGDYDI